jgi:putative transposase
LIVIEHLNVKGMTKNHRLAQAILDAAFNEARRQFEYKCRWYGSGILVADQWFPSSKRCSRCACLKDDLTLDDRVYGCRSCDNVIDRDLNASINLNICTGSLNSPCTDQFGGKACGGRIAVRPRQYERQAVREAGSKHQPISGGSRSEVFDLDRFVRTVSIPSRLPKIDSGHAVITPYCKNLPEWMNALPPHKSVTSLSCSFLGGGDKALLPHWPVPLALNSPGLATICKFHWYAKENRMRFLTISKRPHA